MVSDYWKSTIFCLISVIAGSAWIVTAYYLEHFQYASVGQVFFIACSGGLVIQLILFSFNKEIRTELLKYVRVREYIQGHNDDAEAKLNILKIILRGLFGDSSAYLYLFAASYLSPGNNTTMYSITKLLSALIFNYFIMKIIPHKLTLFGIIPLSIAGIILICQPTFVFGLSANKLSDVGIILSCVSGIFRTSCNLVVTNSKGIHWSAFTLITCVTGTIFASIALIIEHIYATYYSTTPYSVWRTFDIGDSFVLYLSMPLFQATVILAITNTFKYGELLSNSIIQCTGDILLCYLAEFILFGELSNIFTYIGMVCVIFCNVLITYVMYKTAINETKSEYNIVNKNEEEEYLNNSHQHEEQEGYKS